MRGLYPGGPGGGGGGGGQSYVKLVMFAADYAGMMRGLYPGGQGGGGGGRGYPHHSMSSYHQHNLHRYNQVGKYTNFYLLLLVLSQNKKQTFRCEQIKQGSEE